MNLKQMSTAFNRSLGWNAILYLFYKVPSTALTFLLFNHLEPQHFSTWANINSFIFIMVLWLDFGLRKSIARYCPEFEKCGTLTQFLTYVLSTQICLLIIACPLFFLLLTIFFRSLISSCNPFLLYCAVIIFLSEGINSSIKLFYHAHFWNKKYTLIQGAITLLEMGLNISWIMLLKSGSTILVGIFATKVATSLLMACISFIILKKNHKKIQSQQTKQKIDRKKVLAFIRHSLTMWATLVTKSLTERNFLIPFFTYTAGIEQANLFKIANDSALFIHRPIIKTIGTSDITMLTHGELNNKKFPHTVIFKKILKTVLMLCIPLSLGLLVFPFFMPHKTIILLFFIITIGYLLETILSPYERALEVQHQYKKLIIPYFPYLIMLITIGYYACHFSYDMITILAIIHGIRLISSILMVYTYKIPNIQAISIRPAVKPEYYSNIPPKTLPEKAKSPDKPKQ